MKVELLLLPRSSGNFQQHLNSVGDSLKQELKKPVGGRIQPWTPGKESTDSVILIVFQSQGSPAHDFPAALPPELKGSSQRVVVVVIQDDEIASSRRDIVPADVSLLGVVNVHVIPMQHQLHRQGLSLCARNQQAVREIVQLLQDNKNKPRMTTSVPEMSSQHPVKQQGGTVKEVETNQRKNIDTKEMKSLPSAGSSTKRLELLMLPQTKGSFQQHLTSVGDSLKQELRKSWAVDLQTRTPGGTTPGATVLIVFQSQGRPGDEFPAVLPPELKAGGQQVLVAVVQDDEIMCTGRSIVPAGVNLVSVVSLHVVPGQHSLHVSGTSLCPRNMQSIQTIAKDLRLQGKEFFGLLPGTEFFGQDWWKDGTVCLHSLLTTSTEVDPRWSEAVRASIIENLENKGKKVVTDFDQASPSALLLLCWLEDADGEKLKNALQEKLHLPPGYTHKSKTIVAIIQKKEKSKEVKDEKLDDFAQVHQLTVEPPSYSLVKNVDNGKSLAAIARFIEKPS